MSTTGSRRSAWVRHGIWNTFEHAVTRGADAATSLLLLWMLPMETFSTLALAQAWVAPILFFFLCPETILYREYGIWKEEGRSSLENRLAVFRRFAWGKAQLAVFISLLAGWFFPGPLGSVARACAMIWGFALVLAPQVCGPDREFLRLSLNLRELNAVSFFQKVSLLGATAISVFVFDADLRALAAAAVLSLVATALLARWRAKQAMRALPDGAKPLPTSPIAILADAISSFSLWNHVSGVVLNWVQTMDVFFLGFFGTPARELGLYAAVLKLGNLTLAFPLALSNLFSIWVGGRSEQRGTGITRELRDLWKFSGGLFAVGLAQAIVLVALSGWLISLLSHGRWSAEDQLRAVGWLHWIIAGTVALSSGFLLSSWVILRLNPRKVFQRIYLPWGILSLGVYGFSVWGFGVDGAARANVLVGILWLALLAAFRKV